MKGRKEYRTGAFEVRELEDGARMLVGYPIVFNSETDIGGEFREVIRPGALTKTLQEAGRRVVALYQHMSDRVLGRLGVNLSLVPDERGVRMELSLPDTTLARDAYEEVRQGILDGMSFGFRVVKELWDSGRNLREVLELELFEVSVVTWRQVSAPSLLRVKT